jgi:hypothetical protein
VIAARAVPEFQTDEGTPCRVAGCKQVLHSPPNVRIAPATQLLDPARCVDKTHYHLPSPCSTDSISAFEGRSHVPE